MRETKCGKAFTCPHFILARQGPINIHFFGLVVALLLVLPLVGARNLQTIPTGSLRGTLQVDFILPRSPVYFVYHVVRLQVASESRFCIQRVKSGVNVIR